MYQCQTCAVPSIEARTACVHRSSSEGLRETSERYAHLQRLVNGHYVLFKRGPSPRVRECIDEMRAWTARRRLTRLFGSL